MNFLMKSGGCLTLWQIARKSHNGRLLAEAREELSGLIVEEKGKTPNRGKRSGRRCTRVFLTMRGWAAASAIKPGWQPSRLPMPILKEWLRELEEERDPWALSLHEMPPKQFYKMQADAKELARLKDAKWIRPPLRKRGSPKLIKGIQPANGFQRHDGSSPAPGQPVPPREPCKEAEQRYFEQTGKTPGRFDESRGTYAPLAASDHIPGTTKPKAPLSDFDSAMRLQNQAIGSRQPERIAQNRPEHQQPATGESLHEIIYRANVAGYPTREGREVMLESVWVPATTWARAVPQAAPKH